MRRHPFTWALAALFVCACGGKARETKPKALDLVRGFEFEIAIEPSTFLPNAATPVVVASDGDPESNPDDTVQLYTPNDTLTWLREEGGAGIFAFDVEVTNFYATSLCAVAVVVDTLTPATGRAFVDDDRGTAYAGAVTGAGVWAYGDLESGAKHRRRWKIRLDDRQRFVLRGRVLADADACGAGEPSE